MLTFSRMSSGAIGNTMGRPYDRLWVWFYKIAANMIALMQGCDFGLGRNKFHRRVDKSRV